MKSAKTKTIFDGTKNEMNMKQTLIMLSLSMVFVSCGPGGNDQTTALQKQVDSLTSVVSAKGPKTMPMVTVEPGRALFTKGEINFSNSYPIDSFLIPWGYSYWCTKRWDRFVNEAGYRDRVIKQSPACSFVIPKSSLQTLIGSGAEYVVVYLAVDTNDRLGIIYDGAATKADEPQNDTIYEHRIRKDQVNYALDHVWPCPTCDKVGLSDE